MDLTSLRAIAQDVGFAAFGVPATVTRPAPDNTSVVTTAVWLPEPLDETRPAGTDFQRREPRKVLALRRGDSLPTMPRGTIVAAPEISGGAAKNWRVDELDRTLPDEWRVIVVRVS